MINAVLFPPPSKILLQIFVQFQKGLPEQSELTTHILSTLKRLGAAFFAGAIAGVFMGILLGLSNSIFHFFNPLISILMPIPGIALAPLFIIWFGFGDPTIIILGALSTFFPVVYSTAMGVRSVDPQLIRAARIMGLSGVELPLRVHLPWAAAYLLNGIKLGLARGWMTVIAVEFVAASNYGLGYMIWMATEYLRADIVYGGILIMIILFFLLEKLIIQEIERRTIYKWGMLTEK